MIVQAMPQAVFLHIYLIRTHMSVLNFIPQMQAVQQAAVMRKWQVPGAGDRAHPGSQTGSTAWH